MAKENVEVKNQPEVEVAPVETEATNDSTTEHISKPDKSEEIIKSQTGQIQALQKKIAELEQKPDIKTALKDLLGDEKAESDVDPVEALKSELTSLKQQIAQKDAELVKNNYIDGLDEPESVKRYLKNKIGAVDNAQEVVDKELEAVKELLQNSTPKTTDTRPKGIGISRGSSLDADYVLNHPEQFKK